MREYLYRGIPKDSFDGYAFSNIHKDNCDGRFVYGSLLVSKDKYYICVSALCKLNCCINNGITSMIEVIPESVGQFTSLFGNYGKMIFEGDVVKADDFIFEVKFGKCGGVANAEDYGYMGFYLEPYSESTKLSAKYGLRNDICYFIDIEVIGTVHDNPELLKGGAE